MFTENSAYGATSTPSLPEGATGTEGRTAGAPLSDFVMQLEDYTPTVSIIIMV